MHKFFKNLAYFGTCLITSNRAILIFTFQNTSKISLSLFYFFNFSNLLGKRGGLDLTWIAWLEITLGLIQFYPSFSISFSIWSSLFSFGLINLGSSISLPLLRVIVLTFLGFTLGCHSNLPFTLASRWFITVANWLTWFFKLYILAFVFYWNCRVLKTRF